MKKTQLDESWREYFPGTKEWKKQAEKRDEREARLDRIQRQKDYETSIKTWNDLLNKKKKSWVDKAILSAAGIKTKDDAIKLASEFRDIYGTGPKSISKKDKSAFIRLLIELLNVFSPV